MRLVSLAKVAAEAEGVRLKLLARRQAMRGVWGAVAAVFGLFFAVMLHLTIYEFLAPWLGPPYAALVLLGIDAIVIIVFGLMAARSVPGLQEREAEMISRQARGQLADAVTTFSIVAPVARLSGARGWKAAMLSTAATSLLKRRRARA